MHDWQSLPHAPQTGHDLGTLTEVGENGREFVFGQGLSAFRLFVVLLGEDAARGFVNRCPHYSLPLNVQPDHFLTRDGTHIMCRQHLALFDRDSGACISGACEGNGLTPVALTLSSEGRLEVA